MSINVNRVGIGFHAYDPGRFAWNVTARSYEEAKRGTPPNYDLIQDPFYDPANWTDVVTAKGYARVVGITINPDELGVLERRHAFGNDGIDTRFPNDPFLHFSTFDISTHLLCYLKARFPKVHDAIVKSDVDKNAMALLFFNHIMSCFESTNVKKVQVAWGQYGFHKHFGRLPEGFWLPEGGTDGINSYQIEEETLAIAADMGYRFTILPPIAALKIRRIEHRGDESKWENVFGAIDPSKPYRLFLGHRHDGSERFIDIFFYDALLSNKLAHDLGGIYWSSDSLAWHLQKTRGNGFTGTMNDVETHGNHHGYTLDKIGNVLNRISRGEIEGLGLTYYHKELQDSPEYECKLSIHPQSWSCPHGGHARWGGSPTNTKLGEDCDCDEVWNSRWRRDLRNALSYASMEAESIFFNGLGREYFIDPAAALIKYIEVRLGDRDLMELLKGHIKGTVQRTQDNYRIMYHLLEMTRLSMVMKTSCGFFFNGIRIIPNYLNMISAYNMFNEMKRLPLDGHGHIAEDKFKEMLKGVNIESGGLSVYNMATNARTVNDLSLDEAA